MGSGVERQRREGVLREQRQLRHGKNDTQFHLLVDPLACRCELLCRIYVRTITGDHSK